MLNEFQGYLTKIDNLKKGYNKPLYGIIDYERDGEEIYNQSFFPGVNIITQQIIDEKIKEFQDKINEIKQYKKEIKNLNISDIEKRFLLISLNQTGIKYMLFKRAIYLEAEKQGYILSNNNRERYLREVNRLQDMIYGPEISTIDTEKESILKSLQEVFRLNNYKLTDDEKNEFSTFLRNLGVLNGDQFLSSNQEIKKSKQNFLGDIFINKDKFKKILEIVLDIYGLEGRKITFKNTGNFAVSTNEIICPESKIESTPLKRLLQIIDHEIGVHVLRVENRNKTTKVNGENYSEGEEGFATLTEILFDDKLSDVGVKPTIHHITTFIAENGDYEFTKEILKIYYKMIFPEGTKDDKIKTEAIDRAHRVKRYVSFKEKGANRKDVSYTRGQVQLVDFLQSSGGKEQLKFLKDFYYSKLSLVDLELVEDFKKLLGTGEEELKYPLWIGKILYKKLIGEKIFLHTLQQEDFRFQSVEKLTFLTKRKVMKILQIIRG